MSETWSGLVLTDSSVSTRAQNWRGSADLRLRCLLDCLSSLWWPLHVLPLSYCVMCWTVTLGSEMGRLSALCRKQPSPRRCCGQSCCSLAAISSLARRLSCAGQSRPSSTLPFSFVSPSLWAIGRWWCWCCRCLLNWLPWTSYDARCKNEWVSAMLIWHARLHCHSSLFSPQTNSHRHDIYSASVLANVKRPNATMQSSAESRYWAYQALSRCHWLASINGSTNSIRLSTLYQTPRSCKSWDQPCDARVH